MTIREKIIKIVEKLFSPRIMEKVGADHHKNRDGTLVIEYDYWNGRWTISHYGYVRDEVEVFRFDEGHADTADVLSDTLDEFIKKIEHINDDLEKEDL